MKRNSGLDIFRILCCIGVLVYHCVDDILFPEIGTGSSAAFFIYFSASFCIPGFFLLSGFLAKEKSSTDITYYENKIKTLALKLLYWCLFWLVIHYLRTGRLWNLDRLYFGSLIGGGAMVVAWFLFTYALFTFLSYFLLCVIKRRKKKGEYILILAAVLWMIALAFFYKVDDEIPQALWIKLYGGYYLLGMAISAAYPLFTAKASKKTVRILMGAVLFAVSGCAYIYAYQHAPEYAVPYTYYGSWYYTFWVLSIFILAMEVHISSARVQGLLAKLSKNTFAVYLGHLPLLLFLTEEIRPIGRMAEAVGMVLLLFIIWEGLAWIFEKCPLLRKLV